MQGKLTTNFSKIGVWDYNDASELTQEEQGVEGYFVLCMPPMARWLLLSMLDFYSVHSSSFLNFPDEITRIDTIAQAYKGLIKDMACETQLTELVTQVTRIADATDELNNRIGQGPQGESIHDRMYNIEIILNDMESRLLSIANNVSSSALDPTLIDQIEAILNGVGVILGAASVNPTP